MNKIRLLGDGLLAFYCPGCLAWHTVAFNSPRTGNWTWTGGLDKPTLAPSVLVTYDGADAGKAGAPPSRCHSFVRGGRIQFLDDCTHELRGQTLELPDA